MLTLIDLWVPIVIATVLVFIASSVIHMVVKWHQGDFKRLPGEDGILETLRQHGVAPGAYHFPYCSDMKEMGSDETRARFEQGPVGIMNVMPNGLPNMGRMLGLWAVYLLIVSIFVAYVGAAALPPGSEYLLVFRVTGASAFLAYAIANAPASIWFGQPWPTTLRFIVDGLVYSLLVGGSFGAFWPAG